MCRRKENGMYQGTTWQIRFKLDSVHQGGTYKLRIAIASATLAEVQVHIWFQYITRIRSELHFYN